VKRDNQKLSDSLKLKSEENEKLNLTVRNLEEVKKEYELKLQGLPNLHERINHFDKKKVTEFFNLKGKFSHRLQQIQ